MPAPRKILHVIDSFDLGGAQEALVNLIAFSDRARFAPEVAAMHGRGVYGERFRALGVPVHSLSPHKFLPLYFWNLARLLATRRYDIVHCHLFAANLLAKPLAALFGVRVRFNHDQANDRPPRSLRTALDALANRLSTHICAVSVSIVEFLKTHEHVPAERVSLIYNGIDLRRFASSAGAPPAASVPQAPRLHELASAPVIAGIGRFHPQKNFELFIEIAREVRRTHPHATFLLAGTGPEEAQLRAMAGDDVRFIGFVKDTATLYPAIDILLMPSRFEGLPMTLLEAMAMRVPIVASQLDGIAEIIDDGVDGLLATSGVRDEFAAHLRTLLDDPARGERLAEQAFIKVRDRFSAERMTREVEALYDRYLP